MPTDSFLVQLMTSGQVRMEKGTIMFLNEFMILLPVRTFLKLREVLIEKLGLEPTNNLLKYLGKFQVANAFQRYSKTLSIQELTKEKIFAFGNQVSNLLAMGEFKVILINRKTSNFILTSNNIPISVEYRALYGKSPKPIDHYFAGILEESFSRIFETQLVCRETKCVACGDGYCQFEMRPSRIKV